jgi:hypothetical protein
MSLYSRAPYKHDFGQTITTDCEEVSVDRSFLAHYHIDAEDAPAASSDGVHAAMNLGAAVQAITTGITNPAVPRNIRIDGNVSGITGVVKIHGTNFAGEVITEEITADGTTAKDGNLAFKTVTQIDLPIQNHTPAAQTETIEVTNECTNTEEISVAVTATTLLGDDSPESVTVALDSTVHTTVTLVAAAVVEALNENEVIGAVFEASNAGGVITLAAKEPAANDSSLAIAFTAGTSGVTVGSSTNGTTGVPYDVVSIGWGDKFGIPYKLYADELVILKLVNKAKEVSEGTVTADATDLAKNVYDPTDATLGVDIDLYIIV